MKERYYFGRLDMENTMEPIVWVIWDFNNRRPAFINKDYPLYNIKHLLANKIKFINEDYYKSFIILQFLLNITDKDKQLIKQFTNELNAKDLLFRM